MSETIKQLNSVLAALRKHDPSQSEELFDHSHLEYMRKNLEDLGKSIIFFDYGQPWIYYYILSTFSLFKHQPTSAETSSIVKALGYCWNQSMGGFGGGYKQLPHLAPTYSAFLCIILLGPEAYPLVDREGLTKFLTACKIPGGGFQMTPGAETDLRAAYIVTIIVKLLHLDESLLEGVADTIIRSQTYEGGLSNVEGGEAHGGYTFCGVAALSLLGALHLLDTPRLTMWLGHRQCEFGGFNGRTNKLLDSCYSFWVGATFNVVNDYFNSSISSEGHFLYSEKDLQNYITFYCQHLEGGLRDKPGKNRDIYHTCYSLLGCSASQEGHCEREVDRLETIDPIYGVSKKKLAEAREHFQKPAPCST